MNKIEALLEQRIKELELENCTLNNKNSEALVGRAKAEKKVRELQEALMEISEKVIFIKAWLKGV